MITGLGRAADEGPIGQTASFVDRHGGVKVHVGHDVRPSQAVFRQGGQEVLAAPRHAFHAIEHGVAGRAAATGDGIVMAAGVGYLPLLAKNECQAAELSEKELSTLFDKGVTNDLMLHGTTVELMPLRAPKR